MPHVVRIENHAGLNSDEFERVNCMCSSRVSNSLIERTVAAATASESDPPR